MRACTACVVEVSYVSHAHYQAEIEFMTEVGGMVAGGQQPAPRVVDTTAHDGVGRLAPVLSFQLSYVCTGRVDGAGGGLCGRLPARLICILSLPPRLFSRCMCAGRVDGAGGAAVGRPAGRGRPAAAGTRRPPARLPIHARRGAGAGAVDITQAELQGCKLLLPPRQNRRAAAAAAAATLKWVPFHHLPPRQHAPQPAAMPTTLCCPLQAVLESVLGKDVVRQRNVTLQ